MVLSSKVQMFISALVNPFWQAFQSRSAGRQEKLQGTIGELDQILQLFHLGSLGSRSCLSNPFLFFHTFSPLLSILSPCSLSTASDVCQLLSKCPSFWVIHLALPSKTHSTPPVKNSPSVSQSAVNVISARGWRWGIWGYLYPCSKSKKSEFLELNLSNAKHYGLNTM